MSDNGETSQTVTLTEQNMEGISDLTCVEQCSELINQYQLGNSGKANTILEIREVLIKSVSVHNGRNLDEALNIFIGMLDSLGANKEQASERGRRDPGVHEQEEVNREDRGSDADEEREVKKRGSCIDTDTEDGDKPRAKRAKTINTSKFP
ncbi:hypothetical protein P692DRAFT_20727522 [Suillus brevipes Sb2]|nr:hypothetical protein P692DRAFT_20727522 [Suillus brevipes Sb2]